MDVLALKANSTWNFRVLVICFIKVLHARIREVGDKFLDQITACVFGCDNLGFRLHLPLQIVALI
jgi:hypothetical protein